MKHRLVELFRANPGLYWEERIRGSLAFAKRADNIAKILPIEKLCPKDRNRFGHSFESGFMLAFSEPLTSRFRSTLDSFLERRREKQISRGSSISIRKAQGVIRVGIGAHSNDREVGLDYSR